MKKVRITVMMSYEEEYDDEYMKDYNPKTLDDFRDSDYDNIDRPLTRCQDCGWDIVDSHIEIE